MDVQQRNISAAFNDVGNRLINTNPNGVHLAILYTLENATKDLTEAADVITRLNELRIKDDVNPAREGLYPTNIVIDMLVDELRLVEAI